MFEFLHKYAAGRYWSARVILGIDLVMSLASSMGALLLSRVLFEELGTTLGIRFVLTWIAAAFVVSSLCFLLLRTYRMIIRYSTLRELGKVALAVFGKEAVLLAVLLCYPGASVGETSNLVLLLLDLLFTLSGLVLIRIAMVMIYDVLQRNLRRQKSCKRVVVYGLGDKSIATITRLQNSPHYRIIGFLTYGKRLKNHTVAERPVYYFETIANVRYLQNRYNIDAVLFATDNDVRGEQRRLVKFCSQCNLKILVTPTIDEVIDGRLVRQGVREIKIEDLLGRDEIRISMEEIRSNFNGKVVLVTGAAGSIGSELCRQLATFGVQQLVLFDNAETPMHNLRLELEERYPELNFVPVIGDIRQKARLDYAFRTYRPQVVFHAGAYKHVPLMEENPCEAVYVNVAGSRNIADKCIEYGIEKMVMISTDKAVNPTNIMGCTKRLAEIYVQSLGLAIEQGLKPGKTKFVTTRFGNVLGSNGSVIPRFRDQIAHGGPVTVTHPDITRFFMTIPEACRLVMEAATMSTGNQIFVFDMGKSVKIAHLAKRMIELAGFIPEVDIKIEYTGLRPGEKLYEEVLSNKENTLPTSHDRIRVAKVRSYDYAEAVSVVDELERLSCAVDIPAMVRLMKRTVPEFKSKNSEFEKYDAEITASPSGAVSPAGATVSPSTPSAPSGTVSPSIPSAPSGTVSSSGPTATKSSADTQSTPASTSGASPQKTAAQAS